MAILFRPVTNSDAFGNYIIEDYNGTGDRAEIMKRIPMSYVFGALFFFRNLRTELSNHILQFIEAERVRVEGQQTTSKSGDGILQSTNWLKEKLGSLNTSKT